MFKFNSNLLFFLDLLFPKRCLGCGKSGCYFCQICVQELKQAELICPFCKKPSIGGITHPICRRRYGPDGLWSLGDYQGPLKKAIQKLKYAFVRSLAEELVNLVIDYWARYSPLILEEIKQGRGEEWVVVPVPLNKYRENWRGFNQSALLAGIFAKKLGLNYGELLKRVKNTRPQVSLPAEKRRLNIKDAISLNPKYETLHSNILLIDDVWTTGSTLKECSFILKKSGVKSVWALTLAR